MPKSPVINAEKRSKYNSLVVIPALNPAPDLVDYVKELLTRGIPYVIVVNDGSRPDCLPVFEALAALEGCIVLTHPQNRGKGCALKTAYTHVLETPALQDYDGVVTADADGQHHLDDVCNLAATVKGDRERLILGVRDLLQDHVPTRSKIGNSLTSFGFHVFYGAKLGDTQTGLRAIPRCLLQWAVGIKGERFEYEMNVLIAAVREHRGYREMTIHTIYFDNNAGSHLTTFRDPLRIFRVLLSGLGQHFTVTAVSVLLDILVFWLSYCFVFTQQPAALCLLLSVVLGRVLSAAVSFLFNRRNVFGGRASGKVMLRYYATLCVQMLCSYLLVLFFTSFIPWPALIIKIIVDILLSIGGYQVQMHWVFADREEA